MIGDQLVADERQQRFLTNWSLPKIHFRRTVDGAVVAGSTRLVDVMEQWIARSAVV
jgi:hypothetical protein